MYLFYNPNIGSMPAHRRRLPSDGSANAWLCEADRVNYHDSIPGMFVTRNTVQ